MKRKRLSIKSGPNIAYRRKLFSRFGPLLFLCIFVYGFTLYLTASQRQTVFPTQDLEVSLYSNQMGDDLQKTFYDAIQQTKSHATCIIYSLSDPYILHALSTRAELGARITLVHDANAAQYVEKKLSRKIQVSPVKKSGLMHQKLLAIDSKLSFLGSANFTTESLTQHANLVLAIRSERVARAIEEKAQTLQQNKKAPRASLHICNDLQTFELAFLPDDKEALERLVNQLLSAKKSVRVAMFTFTHPKLIQTLVDLHKRNISVQVVLDAESSSKTSRVAFERFKKENMNIRISARHGLLHEKIAIIDDTILVGGSTNWTKAAFTINDEHIFVLSPLTHEQQKQLAYFWKTTLQEASEI